MNALTGTVGVAGGLALFVLLVGALFAATWPAATVAGGICVMGVAVAWLQTRVTGWP